MASERCATVTPAGPSRTRLQRRLVLRQCFPLLLFRCLTDIESSSGFVPRSDPPLPQRPTCQHQFGAEDHHRPRPLGAPVLELITPNGCCSSSETSELIRSVDRAVTGGVSLVQVRDYESSDDCKAEFAARLGKAIGGRAWIVVNGEPGVARACDADGVHLPERMIDLLEGGRDHGDWPLIVGCSVHSVTAAQKAAEAGADYVQVGTMFGTQSHPGKEPEGLPLLQEVRRRLQEHGFGDVLVLGVGGIDAANCGDVVAAGGDGVAAIRCLCEGVDPNGQARTIVEAMERSLAAASTERNRDASL